MTSHRAVLHQLALYRDVHESRSEASCVLPAAKRIAVDSTLLLDLGHIRAENLAALIRGAAGRLTSVRMGNTKLHILGDFELVTDAVQSRSHQLEQFTCHAYCLAHPSQDRYARLGEALANAPRLSRLLVKDPSRSIPREWPITKVVLPILKSSRLLQLYLRIEFPQEEDARGQEELKKLLRACRESPSLREMFWKTPKRSGLFQQPHIDAFADLLRNNSTLQEVSLALIDPEASLAGLAQALKTNSSLKELICRCSEHSTSRHLEEELAAFSTVLREDNHTLENLFLYQSLDALDLSEEVRARCSAYEKELDFFLSLNQKGRSKLLGKGASSEDWVDAISKEDDVAVIFYYLRKNPALSFSSPVLAANVQERAHLRTGANAAEATTDALLSIAQSLEHNPSALSSEQLAALAAAMQRVQDHLPTR